MPDPYPPPLVEMKQLKFSISNMAYKNPTADIDNLAQQLLRDVSSAMTDDADSGSKSDSDFESDSSRDSSSVCFWFLRHDLRCHKY